MTIQDLAKAIARAEGYYAGSTRPFVSNNPGSLFPGGKWGVYSSPERGWAALHKLLENALSGKGLWKGVVTWRDFAWMYVNGTLPNKTIIHASDEASGGPNQWARNVLAALKLPCSLDCAWKSNLQ